MHCEPLERYKGSNVGGGFCVSHRKNTTALCILLCGVASGISPQSSMFSEHYLYIPVTGPRFALTDRFEVKDLRKGLCTYERRTFKLIAN